MDPLVSNIEEFLDQRPNLGYRFEKKIAEMRIEKKITQDDENNLRNRSQHFLLCLFKQLKQRLPLPDNLNLLKNISLFSIENILKHVNEPIIPILELICMREEDIAAAEYQYNTIHLHQWTNIKNTEQFWVEVNDSKDASGRKPFKEISDCAIKLLILPNSNAEVERVFSSMNIVETKCNYPCWKLFFLLGMASNAIINVAKIYDLPPSTLKLIGTMAAYDINKKDNENIEHVNEEDYEDIISLDDIIAHSSL